MPDEFYNLAQKKVGNKTEPNWGIKLKLDKRRQKRLGYLSPVTYAQKFYTEQLAA